MMSKIKQDAPYLLPKHARVFENPLGYVHDAENNDPLYGLNLRDEIIKIYKKFSEYNKIRVHSSVFQRLSETKEKKKQIGYDSEWYKINEFKDCFDAKNDGSYMFKKCSAIEEVSNTP